MLFLDGPGWTIASRAYIHNGPWLLGPDEPLKHLFMASGGLKKTLKKPQIANFHGFEPTTPSGMHFWAMVHPGLPKNASQKV